MEKEKKAITTTKNEFVELCRKIAIDGAKETGNDYDKNVLMPHIFSPPFPTEPTETLAYEAEKLFDFLVKHKLIKKTFNVVQTEMVVNDILLVEDGSVDVEALESKGYKVLIYRQGANPPRFIKELKD